MQLKCSVVARCQNGAHPLTTTAVLFCQTKALRRIAIDLPGSLAGKRQFHQPHKSGYIFGRITDKEADFMRERIICHDATAQFIQQRPAWRISFVAGFVQQGADTGMGQVALKMVMAVAQHEERPFPRLQYLEGDIAKAGRKALVVALPELIKVSTAGTDTINERNQVCRFDPCQHLGAFQHQMCSQAVQRIAETLDNSRLSGWLDRVEWYI